MVDVMEELAYGPELSELSETPPTPWQLGFSCSASYRVRGLDAVLRDLCARVDRREEVAGQEVAPGGCAVHKQGVRQLMRVLRALLVPGGHGALMGSDRGTGRKTTVRLAARLAGCRLLEVHAGNEDRLRDVLKEAGNHTREDEGHVVLLVHEGVGRSATEELLVAMAHPAYPGLYTEELGQQVSRVTARSKSRRHLLDRYMDEDYLSRIHRNVHVFLLLPFTTTHGRDTHDDHGFNGHVTRALRLSVCVEVYESWSHQSLVEVAARRLKTISHTSSQHQEAGLAAAMASVHRSACRHAAVLLGAQPFSPRTYMEFMANFDYVSNHLRNQQQSNASRLAAVLARWTGLTAAAEQRTREVERLQEASAQTRQRLKDLVRAADVMRRRRQARQAREAREAREARAVQQDRLRLIEEQISYAHKQGEAALQAGMQALGCLSLSDLEEVRHYRDPPPTVVAVMDAICLLFERPAGWESAKQLLGRPDFFQDLEFFDRQGVSAEQLQRLGPMVQSASFSAESVLEASRACVSLRRWVLAVYEGRSLQRPLQLERQLAALARETKGLQRVQRHQEDERCGEQDSTLQVARTHLEEDEHCDEEDEHCDEEDEHCDEEDSILQVQLAQRHLEEDELQLLAAEREEREATAAAEKLQAHVATWRAAAQEAELDERCSGGDALTLAAIISYLGPLGPDTRTQLLSKWRQLLETGSVDADPEDPLASLFARAEAPPPAPPHGFPVPVSQRLQRPLGRALGVHWDAPPATLVVKLLLWSCRSSSGCVQRCPLLADTQQHLDMSSLSRLGTGEEAELEAEAELELDPACELLVGADDPELLDKLDRAAERGLTVLVTHLERVSPSPLLAARLQRRVGPTQPEFCLFLSTELPARLLHSDLHPSILAQVGVVDLSLGAEDVQELLLARLLQTEERRPLLLRRLQLRRWLRRLQQSLAAEEDALLDAVLRADSSLLQVAAPQRAAQQQLAAALRRHESLLAAPRAAARLAASFYRALQDVSRLSPAYYFSLRGFVAAVGGAFAAGKHAAAAGPEVENRLAARLLARYGPCLSRSHVAVLELLLSAALLRHRGLCSEAESAAFLQGLPAGAEGRRARAASAALPRWIPARVHPQLLSLDQVPAFSGLKGSLCRRPAQWRRYLRLPSAGAAGPPSAGAAGPVPCRSHAHLSLLQRALLWKALRPGCLAALAEAMAAFHPGPAGPGGPEALRRYVAQHEGPVILTVPPHREGGTGAQPLHLVTTLAQCGPETTTVEVVPWDPDLVLKLNAAAQDGRWLVLRLRERLDRAGAAHLGRLVRSLAERPAQPGFRFWIIAGEEASCSIPAALRVRALLLVCEAPRALQEQLVRSLQQLQSVLRRRPAASQEPLLRCAAFHSVLLQRQRRPARGRSYSWTQEDLLALADAHLHIACVCHDGGEALRRIAAHLVHGGHVVHPADLQLLDSAAKAFLSAESPLWGAGPRSSSAGARRHAPSELLQVLEQRLQGLAALGEDAAAEVMEIHSRDLDLLLRASQTPQGAARRSLATPLSRVAAADRLSRVVRLLTGAAPALAAGPVSHLGDFLRAERDHLVRLATALLSRPRPLLRPAHLSGLERRARLIAAHLDASEPPAAYRLSAFRNARGLLAALRRDAARARRRHVSDITLHFQVVSDGAPSASLPLDAVFLCGLQLRGASWDTRLGALTDPAPLQPCSLPLVCVSARVGSERSDPDASPLYRCPLYLQGGRGSADGDIIASADGDIIASADGDIIAFVDDDIIASVDDDIIASIPLRTEIDPVVCSLRRVRLESSL